MKRVSALLAICLLASLAGCKAAKTYPDPAPGWHSSDFTTVFGRLQRVPGAKPTDPPVWVIRFGQAGERYGGELGLTPADRIVGFAGGEQVEVKGALRSDYTNPAYNGTWFEVQSIKLWSNHY